jgi:hypothetical protein
MSYLTFPQATNVHKIVGESALEKANQKLKANEQKRSKQSINE